MKDLERLDNILNYLKKYHSATVESLAKEFYASPSTIRRDLTSLEKTGMIHRTHGGAIYNDRIKEVSILVRKKENEAVKNELAVIASKYIPEFNSIFIDNSSTCLQLIKYLDLNKKLVVTNSLIMVSEIKSFYDANIIFLGGEYDLDTMSSTGPLAIDNLNDFHFDLMVQSAAFVDIDGAYENEFKVSIIKKVARERSTKHILIFDKSKLEKNASYKSSSLENFDTIVCDLSDEEIAKFKEQKPFLNIQNK